MTVFRPPGFPPYPSHPAGRKQKANQPLLARHFLIPLLVCVSLQVSAALRLVPVVSLLGLRVHDVLTPHISDTNGQQQSPMVTTTRDAPLLPQRWGFGPTSRAEIAEKSRVEWRNSPPSENQQSRAAQSDQPSAFSVQQRNWQLAYIGKAENLKPKYLQHAGSQGQRVQEPKERPLEQHRPARARHA